jgi:pyrroloquinoline quinone biosynthesis protein B
VHETLCTGTGLLRTLGSYTRVAWRPVAPGTDVSLAEAVSYRAFSIPTTKGARFGAPVEADGVVGYRITNAHTGRALVYLPGVEALTAPVRAELEGCSCLLVDGTCWRDDELIRLGVAGRTSREMGHVPIAGAGGSLELLSSLSAARRVYVHVNNTNPVLLEDSPERRIVEEHGFEVAEDGLELEL